MSFIATIRSLADCRIFGVRLAMEMPALSFNRMCYGYLQNDWITVVSSGVALIVAYVFIALESAIELNGGVNEFPPPPSYTFELRHSHLSLLKRVYHQFFDHLSVSGSDSSSLHISGHNHIWDLQLMNLENTVIEQSVELRKVKTSFEGKSFVETSSSERAIELKSTSLK